MQPDIDYYNDDLSDNDGQDSEQHEVVQHAQILHILSR